MTRLFSISVVLIAIGIWACADDSVGGVDAGADMDIDTDADSDTDTDADSDWPGAPNDYSWDGSWNPSPGELPPDGLYDTIYFDGHEVDGEPSPILPPGEWDWNQTSELANWNNFADSLGTFELLEDSGDRAFGWRFIRNDPSGADASAAMNYFHGSSGTDIVDLGPQGSFHSTGNPTYGSPMYIGDGPDMVRYTFGYSAAMRVGSSATGHLRDNDLVLAGSNGTSAVDTYDITTTTIHTGPGNDLVFVNNFERAGVDLGNGDDGRTDAIDANDGGDIVVIGGNARDFRVFGGNGDDIFVWKVAEVNHSPDILLGPNFFGGGGWGEAVWGDDGVDRLILDIPIDTQVVGAPADLDPGFLLVMVEQNYETVIDTPTENDLYARYYVKAPPGGDNRKTMTLQYISGDESVNTAYFYITAIEELQVGVGEGAVVYALDDVAGEAVADPTAAVYAEIWSRADYETLMDTFLAN